MAAPVSSSLSAARTPPNLSSYPCSCPCSCSSQSSRPQVYCGPHDLPRSSYSPLFAVSISASKLHPLFLHHRLEKSRTRRIHGQVCRSLSFSFHSDESTEDAPMDGQERESASRHLADKASARNTATLSKNGKFKHFGQDKEVGLYPSPLQKPNDGSMPQKNVISGRSRFQGEFYASRSEVETDILRDAVEDSKFSFNEKEKRRYLFPQRDDQESMAQKHIPPQSSRFHNPFYASRIAVDLDHSNGANASENSGNGHDKQLSLYSNQLVETGHHINVVDSLKISANKANQRSWYSYQQVENDQGNRRNPSLSKQEKQPSLYNKSQQINNPQDSFHNRKPPNSMRMDNDGEQSTAYSSKLEEILAKFKKNPGFHKDPRADRANDFRSQHVEAEMVQDKNDMSRLKKESRQGSSINPNASEGGRKTSQYQHKQGRSPSFNDKLDLFGKEKPSMEAVDGRDSLSQKSLFSLSGSSSTPRKTKRHTSESIGSRSKPSRLSVPSSNAVDKSQERILSVEQDDEGASSREKSPLNRSGSSNISWKAKREHTLSSKILIQTKPGRNALSSTDSHSSLSRTLAPSSDAKNPWHGKSQKMSVKQSVKKENGSKIAKSARRLINGDVPQVTIQDFGNSTNETDIDTSDSGGEYDSSWSIDSDNDEPENSFTEQQDCSNKTTSGNSPSEVMDSNVSSSPNDKPSVATWHKHSIPDIPFEFQYSYTETPNIPVVRYRETPFSPFGPSTMERPWTGRAPLKPSKKKLPEFDSFKPPPKGKKGIKFVQDPGPFPKGEGPKPSRTREEIMGEPLTKEEITELVERCYKERRQLNLGRDGLTHNMLDLIHCHWKRRRVCKIKCIGVPTLDMKNVCFHVEDKTGGKIIYQTGGILYLYRGRNYNYKDRPKIPIMLWRPVTPVYPKLIQEAPVGLTKEEANKLRQLGEKVEPMCKLGKNGVYLSLVEDTRAAFKIDELVRIDCQGLNPSDYKKIGAKLRDLVPCVLLSFDNEHILMWKGKENHATVSNSQAPEEDDSVGQSSVCEDSHVDESSSPSITLDTLEDDNLNKNIIFSESESFGNDNSMHESEKKSIPTSYDIVYESNDAVEVSETPSLMDAVEVSETPLMDAVSHVMDEKNDADLVFDTEKDESIVLYIDDLWESAIASGRALELNVGDVDSDEVAKKSRELAKSAPIGPSYTEGLMRQLKLKTPKIKKPDELRIQFGKTKKKQNRLASRPYKTQAVDVPPSGGLPVTELARLLASR